MTPEPVRVQTPRMIAGKFLGGFVPAVAFHFGVLEVLEDRGFRLRRGFRQPGQARETGPPGLDLVVGSSAGAFFVTAAAAGATREDLVGATEEGAAFAPFRSELLGAGPGMSIRVARWLAEGPRASWASRRGWKSWAAENTLNLLFPLWRLDPLREYLRDEILMGKDWEDLKTEAAILAVDLNHPVTLILGEKESPILGLLRREPVSPEAVHLILGSEGRKIRDAFVTAGVDPEHPVLARFREYPDVRNTALYVKGVPMESAATGSMAAYPIYAPVDLATRDGDPVRIGHYPLQGMDGEDRNPFTTDVAEEAGADLILISSISAPYKYLHGVGSLSGHGYTAMHEQKTAHSRDAKQEDVIRAHTEHRRLYHAARSVLIEHQCSRESIERLEEEFHRIAWIRNVRIRIYPDPDIGAENHILRSLDPLEFTPEAIRRASDLGRTVTERVLEGYEFEFL